MAYKFEKLEVWQLAVAYTDVIYAIAEQLPGTEQFNLRSQITRAANSIVLNIAEGSTSQGDVEQARFVGYAIRSLIETVACQHLVHRRAYLDDAELLREAYGQSENLFKKLQAFRSVLKGNRGRVSEGDFTYYTKAESPF